MKAILQNPKFWLVAALLGLLAMRAGCPPGIRRAAVPPPQQVSIIPLPETPAATR